MNLWLRDFIPELLLSGILAFIFVFTVLVVFTWSLLSSIYMGLSAFFGVIGIMILKECLLVVQIRRLGRKLEKKL